MPDMAIETFQTQLESGLMQLYIHSVNNWHINDLFDMAQRRNPRRAFLFVSKVLGRHIPQTPAVIRKAFTDLAAQIPLDLPTPILITGMAETAVGLAAGVHQAYTERTTAPCMLLTSTRHALDAELLCQFKEEHSHATDHLVHLPHDPQLKAQLLNSRTLIMVDDEATTGKTFLNLFHALKEAGLSKIEHVVTVTLTDWSDGKIAEKLNTSVPTTNIALASGKWHWTPAENVPIMQLPEPHTAHQALQALNCYADQWGRIGLLEHTSLLNAKPPTVGERILVLGTSEYVWQPFLLAESLAKQGAHVKFSATTRSPIAIGHTIKQAISFSDNYGINVPMFVYNVEPTEHDRVILCSETPLSSWDQSFIKQFPNLEFLA